MRSMLRENSSLRPTARTLWEVQEIASKAPVEVATNVYRDITRQAQRAARTGEARRLAVRDAESLRRYQEQVRSIFLRCIGGLSAREESACAQPAGQQACGNFTLEKVLLRPGGDAFATANVYVPRQHAGPRPAVLLLIGHTDQGKADPEYQLLAQMLVHAGFVTLVLDPLGEGERFEHYEQDLHFQPIQGCSGEHDLLDWKCKLLGQSLARYFIRDGLAALDYLASREDVDPCRIALTGHSGGGTQVCMLMLCAGERFACAAPCAYVTDVQAMIECGVDADNEMVWPGSLAQGLDYIDLLAGMAPKPLLLLTNAHDFFPREGTQRTFERAVRLWRAAGSSAVPELVTACSQHAYPASLARSVTQFFSRHLLGREAELSGFTFTPLEASQTFCTPEGVLLKAFPAMRTVHDALLDALCACRKRHEALGGDEVRAWLEQALHCRRIASDIESRVYAEGVCGHYIYRCLAWRPQEGYYNTGVLLADMRSAGKRLPTVIALWPEGLSRLCEHSNWLHRATCNGWQVLVMDVTASGSLMPASLGGSGMYIGWGTFYKLSTYLLQLGDSLFALRTRQAIAAARMLFRWPETDAQNIRYYAQGECARVATVASLLTGIPAATDDAYQPYEDIVAQRYHDQTHTHEWIFPGVLQALDTGMLAKLAARERLGAQDPARQTPQGSGA